MSGAGSAGKFEDCFNKGRGTNLHPFGLLWWESNLSGARFPLPNNMKLKNYIIRLAQLACGKTTPKQNKADFNM